MRDSLIICKSPFPSPRHKPPPEHSLLLLDGCLEVRLFLLYIVFLRIPPIFGFPTFVAKPPFLAFLPLSPPQKFSFRSSFFSCYIIMDDLFCPCNMLISFLKFLQFSSNFLKLLFFRAPPRREVLRAMPNPPDGSLKILGGFLLLRDLFLPNPFLNSFFE